MMCLYYTINVIWPSIRFWLKSRYTLPHLNLFHKYYSVNKDSEVTFSSTVPAITAIKA